MKILDQNKLKAMEDPSTFVPEHTRGSIVKWIEQGIPPGSFIRAIITNDLTQTFARADDINVRHIKTIVCWFYNYAPRDCWGSVEICEEYN